LARAFGRGAFALRVAHARNVFFANKEAHLFGAALTSVSDGLAIALNTLGRLALVDAILAAELSLIGGGMLATACFLRKALIECAWIVVVTALLRPGLADAVRASVVLGALTAILATGCIKCSQATCDWIARIVCALIAIVTNDGIKSLA
jgi:hypothetical protein